jgi:phosphoribulokinase
MSIKHPIIAITGSSGAGTTSVKQTFEQIFRREKIDAVYIEGDAFHRWDRLEMREQMKAAAAKGDNHYSHFGHHANLFEELEATFRAYSESGGGRTRAYIHGVHEAEQHGAQPGTFTAWREIEPGSDLLFYEGLHGAVTTDKVNVAQYGDLKIGVVPVINLEWIQKLHRDKAQRGYTTEAVADTILRRMPDYINIICPQFAETDINFQRVPTVDTSNPFIARWIPTPDDDGRHPLQGPARHRLPLPAVDDPRELHEPRQLDRDPRRQARHRDAVDPHADDSETGGARPPSSARLSVEPRRARRDATIREKSP